MIELAQNIVLEIWLVTAAMAAYLLLGFLVAGLLSVFISPTWLERHLGGRGMGPVIRASLFGVPLPLCSCGVIPVAASLRQHGASKSATTAFLLSTPQTGVDSIMVTWTMLGPLFAVFRPVAALLTGFLGGGIVQAAEPPQRSAEAIAEQLRGQTEAEAAATVPRGVAAKIKAALDYGLITLPADIGRALLVGVLIAGLLSAVIPADFLASYLGAGPASVALMMVVGIPIYVCATASVPLAASFIFLGASPGAALAFLIAGPATNAATITTVARVLGRRPMIIYLATVAVSAFGGGLLLDWLLPRAAEALPVLDGGGHHHEGVGWIDHLGGGLLVVVMTSSWWIVRRRGTGCGCDGTEPCSPDVPAAGLEVQVEGMHCSHCTGSVEKAVLALSGVNSCRVLLQEETVRITGSKLDTEAIVQAIEGLGFNVRMKN